MAVQEATTYTLGVTSDRSVGDLFRLAVDGDQGAWAELVERLSPAIWGAARTCGLNRAQTEDVFGTVWLRLLDRADTIRDPERLAGWIYTTARHESLALVRAQTRLSSADRLDDMASNDAAPETEVERNDVIDLIWAGLNQLDQRCEQLLRMVTMVPKVPYKVIAEHLGMPVGSIGPTRERCLAKLRATPSVISIVETST